MTRGTGLDARCKCRQCGAVTTAREWNVAGGGGACPSCGHRRFSISFARPPGSAPAPTPVASAASGAVDAHGRHRRVVRREDFASAPPRAGADFERRLRERLGLPRGSDDDETG